MTMSPARALLAVAVAVVLGPFMAAVGMWLMMLVATVIDPSGWLPSLKDAIAGTPKIFTILVMGSYRVGSTVALLAGLMVGLWMIRRPPNLLVVLAASVVASLIWLGLTEPQVFRGIGHYEDLYVMPPVAAFAGAACWILLRRFARRA